MLPNVANTPYRRATRRPCRTKTPMATALRDLLRPMADVTATEYTLIAALIVVVTIVSVTALGDLTEIQFDRAETTIRTPAS